MTFSEYLNSRFNGNIIIRIADDVAFIYKTRLNYILLIDCCLAWNKPKNDYSKMLKAFLKVHNYNEQNILSQNTYEEMIDSLMTDHHLSQFEKSNKQFPQELFYPKKP